MSVAPELKEPEPIRRHPRCARAGAVRRAINRTAAHARRVADRDADRADRAFGRGAPGVADGDDNVFHFSGDLYWVRRRRRWRCSPFRRHCGAGCRDMGPILAAAITLLAIWEIITAGLHWLPMPYFPSPAGVLQSLVNDRALILDSTWHSLLLLLGGYAVGVLVGLITGICIGWFAPARYWGMPRAQGARADSGDGVDSARDGRGPIGDRVGRGPDRARRLVSGDDAHGLRDFEYARLLPRCGADAGRRPRLSDLPRGDSGGDAEHFHRAVHGAERLVPDAGGRGDRWG